MSKSSSVIKAHSGVGDLRDVKLSWRRFGVDLDPQG